MKHWRFAVLAVVAVAVLVSAGVAVGSRLDSAGGVQLCASPGDQGRVTAATTTGCSKNETALSLAGQDEVTALQQQVADLQQQAAEVTALQQQVTALQQKVGDLQQGEAYLQQGIAGLQEGADYAFFQWTGSMVETICSWLAPNSPFCIYRGR